MVTDLTDTGGAVQTPKAKIGVRLVATNAPVRPVDAMLGLDGVVLDGLGDHADIALAARGTLREATLRARIASPNASMEIEGGGGGPSRLSWCAALESNQEPTD